jgi:hypothetical protein
MTRYEYPQQEDGAVVRITPGRRFGFACCGETEDGCNLVHDLYFRVNDDGSIAMQVFRNEDETTRLRALADTTSRRERRREERATRRAVRDNEMLFVSDSADRKDHHMTRQERRRLRDENSPLDENGILKDGHVLRVSMLDAERSRAGRFSAVDTTKVEQARQITEAVLATREAMGDAPLIITTSLGDRQFTDADAAMHRPGYRLTDGSTTTEEEHHVTHRRRKTVYRDPSGREAGTSESDAMNDTERAFKEMLDYNANAYKGDAAVNNQGASTRAIPASSATGDRWPLSAGAGNPCMTNGAPGVLVPSADGTCLVCSVAPLQATRADATGAAPPRSMTAADAAAITGQAWREYVTEVENAWR